MNTFKLHRYKDKGFHLPSMKSNGSYICIRFEPQWSAMVTCCYWTHDSRAKLICIIVSLSSAEWLAMIKRCTQMLTPRSVISVPIACVLFDAPETDATDVRYEIRYKAMIDKQRWKKIENSLERGAYKRGVSAHLCMIIIITYDPRGYISFMMLSLRELIA